MIEFYEVLARIAEVYSAYPIGDEFMDMVKLHPLLYNPQYILSFRH